MQIQEWATWLSRTLRPRALAPRRHSCRPFFHHGCGDKAQLCRLAKPSRLAGSQPSSNILPLLSPAASPDPSVPMPVSPTFWPRWFDVQNARGLGEGEFQAEVVSPLSDASRQARLPSFGTLGARSSWQPYGRFHEPTGTCMNMNMPVNIQVLVHDTHVAEPGRTSTSTGSVCAG